MNEGYKKHLKQVRIEIKEHLRELGHSIFGMKVQTAYQLYADSKGFKVPSDKRKAEDYLIYRKYGYFVSRASTGGKKKVKSLPNTLTRVSFYSSDEWQEMKRLINNFYDARCMKCGVIKTMFHVDHILPRSLYPEYELHPDNLQRLCKSCNEAKSNKEMVDYRNQLARKRFIERLIRDGMNVDYLHFQVIARK